MTKINLNQSLNYMKDQGIITGTSKSGTGTTSVLPLQGSSPLSGTQNTSLSNVTSSVYNPSIFGTQNSRTPYSPTMDVTNRGTGATVANSTPIMINQPNQPTVDKTQYISQGAMPTPQETVVNLPDVNSLGITTNKPIATVPTKTISGTTGAVNLPITEKTPADMWTGTTPGLRAETPLEKDARLAREAEQARLLTEAAPETEADRRTRLTQDFQTEIDDISRRYAVARQEATRLGQGRLGTDTAIQARRGLIGSTFGEAATTGMEQFNVGEMEKVNVAEGMARAAVEANLRAAITQSRKDKKAAQKLQTEAYAAYKETLPKVAEQRAAQQVQAAIAAKYKAKDSELEDWATKLGVDPTQFKKDYTKAKEEAQLTDKQRADKEKELQSKLQTELINRQKTNADIYKPFNEGGRIYQYGPGGFTEIAQGVSTSASATGAKTYDSKTITPEIKSTLLQDVKNADSAEELMTAYPNVDTNYITELYDSLN